MSASYLCEHPTPPRALSGRLIAFPGRALLCGILYTDIGESREREVHLLNFRQLAFSEVQPPNILRHQGLSEVC
jgi:hypothetical protein